MESKMDPELHYWCKLLVFIAVVSSASSAAIGNNEGRGGLTAYVANMSVYVDSTAGPGSKLFDTTLICTVTPLNISNRIPSNDRANWKLGIFGSDNRGNRKKEVTHILPRAQRGLPMLPGEDLTFWVTTQLNLKGIGSGTSYPYLCVELSKADSNEDFEFPQGSFISCIKFTPPDGNTGGGVGESGGLQVLVSDFGLQLTTTPGQSRIGVAATIELRNDTDPVPDAQFRLGIFGSKKKSGSKRRLNEVRQILPPEDTTHPVYAGSNVEINVETEYDLGDPRLGANFPFVCVELERLNDDANFEMPTTTETGTFITCLLHGSAVVTPVRHPQVPAQKPRVRAYTLLDRLVFSIVPNTTLLDVNLTYEVDPRFDSDPIPPGETANWRLGFYGSAGPGRDGRWKEIPQILSPKQQRLPMYPGQYVAFDVTLTGVDLTGIGTGTDYPYVCVEFENADKYHRNFILYWHRCCRRVSNLPEFDYINNYVYPTSDPGPGDGPRTEVILHEDNKVYQMERNIVRLDVVVSDYVTPYSMYYGTNCRWGVKLWTSGEKDGSGPKFAESNRRLLGGPHTRGEVPRKVSFNDHFLTLDLTDVKCEAVKYLCAEARLFDPPLTGCTRLKCEKRPSREERSIELPGTSKADEDWEGVLGVGKDFVDFVGSKSLALPEGFTFWGDEPGANDTGDNVDQSLTTYRKA